MNRAVEQMRDTEQSIFSERLLKKLAQMRRSRLSVVEAPAGYGKTTAVSFALRDQDAVAWYTGVEDLPDTSFYWFVRQLAALDDRFVRRVEALGFVNRSNAARAAQILTELRVEKPLTLVFDNFQFAAANWQPQIIDALAKRPADGLHVIFITQNLGRLRGVVEALEGSVCFLGVSDLLLCRDDLCGAAAPALSEAQADEIVASTGGLPAAVSLCLAAGGVSGELDDLLYRIFWKRLDDAQREALLRLCLFDCITPAMLSRLLPDGALPGGAREELFRRTPLVRHDPARDRYYPHELLLHFLRARLAETDPALRREIYARAGIWYRDNGSTRAAVDCFFQAEDDEGLLSCRLVGLITEHFSGVSYTHIARTVLSRCPQEIRRRYPLSLLRLCYALYAGCDFAEFSAQMAALRPLLEELGDKHLLGEWELLDALEFFPELGGMDAAYARAEKLLTHESELFIPEEPFFFGCPSMWYLFYAEPGQMMSTAARLTVVLGCYNRLTGGHAAGMAEIYRGEAYSVQGRFEESDIQAYQAAFLSEQAQNASATYGAALLLGINAIYRSDMAGLQRAVEYLENKAQGYAFLHGTSLGASMTETVRGYLLGLMMQPNRSALWAQGAADSLSDLTFTNFMIKTCRITDLLLRKEYQRAIASVEASLELDTRLVSAAARNFMYSGLALCYLAIGQLGKAAQWLGRSLSIAEQDKNYSFLACFRKYFQVLFLLPSIASNHAQAIREIKALGIHYTRADESRIFAMLDDVPELKETLTDREREVAELAARGLRNHEIAQHLHISENTVKHHLKNAFQKMNIDRRSRLIEMLR